MKVTKRTTAVWGPGHTEISTYTTDLPAGLEVEEITGGGTSGNYFLKEFPEDIFLPGSFELHDALHYGVLLTPEQVEDLKPFKVEILAFGESTYSGNQLRFEHHEEAEAYAIDLAGRWTMVDKWRVVDTRKEKGNA